MFGNTKPAKPESRIDTLIGAGTRINGDVTFTGGLRVEGQILGNVSGEGRSGTLMLAENARIEGEVHVAHAVINGTVVGPVRGEESVELQPKANVTGDVQYKSLEVHLGAVLQGNLVHTASAQGDKVVQFKPATGD